MSAVELCNRIGIEFPIVQGPFGGGFSTPHLVAAVCNAGGLGSMGMYHMSPEEISRAASEIRALTSKPFNLNLWVSNCDPCGATPSQEDLARIRRVLEPFYRELGIDPPLPQPKKVHSFKDQVHAVIETRPAVFSFIFGIPPRDVLEDCRKKEILLAGSATTPEEARALEQAGVDLIVASGFEAGGHRPSFLARAEDSLYGTMSLTAQVTSIVRVPVISAGGIADSRGTAAALALGANGVQVGTAFLACEESGATALHRALLRNGVASKTVLTRANSGRLARAIENRLHRVLNVDPLPFPAQSWMVSTLRQAALQQNRPDLLALWCGQSADLIQHTKAAELARSLAGGWIESRRRSEAVS